MSLKHNFCSSPWFHMRIDNQGNFDYCRWAGYSPEPSANIVTTDPLDYFKNHMAPLRKTLVDGNLPDRCHRCNQMEQHGKVSGRVKQLLKIGVRLENFEKTLKSSPWFDTITAEKFQQLPQDWQIDLGNYCNSACVFCDPRGSSRLAQEWKKLGFIKQLPPRSWTDDPDLLKRFVLALQQSSTVKYLHFIGGETLITPAFKTILETLLVKNFAEHVTLGLTTNLTVWPPDVIDLLSKFTNVHLGVSVESFHNVNDYVRWPSKIDQVQQLLNRWLDLVQHKQWLMQIRTTPTMLTVGKLLEIYDFAWQNNLPVESCNFLQDPAFLKPSVLPMQHRQKIISEMSAWLQQHQVDSDIVVNDRNPNLARGAINQDLTSYINYLTNEPRADQLLPDAMSFLKRLDANRGLCVLDYLPEYATLFRSAGY